MLDYSTESVGSGSSPDEELDDDGLHDVDGGEHRASVQHWDYFFRSLAALERLAGRGQGSDFPNLHMVSDTFSSITPRKG